MLDAVLALLLSDPAAAQTLAVKRVAVLQFETAHVGASGLSAGDLFGVFLQQSFPGLSVVERTRLERLLAEQHLEHLSGLVDRDTAARLQSILGVDSIVIGSILAMDLEVEGGGGTLMMTARLVDTSSGRVLWAETRTVRVAPSFLKRVARGFSGARGESDAFVTSRLIEKAAFALVQDLGRHLARSALVPEPAAPAAVGGAPDDCGAVEARADRLGESVLSEEAIYWAHRMREESALPVTPGAGYRDDGLRQRLTTKILFWLGERALPSLTRRQTERLAAVKAEIKGLYAACLPKRPELARFFGPPSPER